MDNKAIGLFISTIRKSKHMTQQGLADKLGVTNKAISKWETGEGYPEITIIPNLAMELGVSVDELLAASLHETSDTYQESLLPLHLRYHEIIRFMKLNALALSLILIGLGTFVFFLTWKWQLSLLGAIIMFVLSLSSVFIFSLAYKGVAKVKFTNPNASIADPKSSMGHRLRRMFLVRLTLSIIFIATTIPLFPYLTVYPYVEGFSYLFWLIVSMICASIILLFIFRNVKTPSS